MEENGSTTLIKETALEKVEISNVIQDPQVLLRQRVEQEELVKFREE